MTPGKLDLRAYRWTPFIFTMDFEGQDFTGASFASEIRMYRDANGSALATLDDAAEGDQGISFTVATVDDVPTSTVTMQIDETTLEALLPFPANGRPSDDPDVPLVWDLHITLDGLKRRWLEGKFTIVAGSTH